MSYKLPGTFKEFFADDTIKLSGYRDNASDAKLELSVFRSTGAGVGANLYECGTKTTIFGSGVANTWVTTSHTGNEKTDGTASCDFQAGEYVIFKIDMTAANNANVYVENLEFRYTNT